MKNGTIITILLLNILGLHAVFSEEYRDFMDAQGRAIRGRVLRYDARKSAVTIERDNKKVVTVPLTVFSKQDQDYVRSWEHNKIFLSDSSFEIEARRKEVDNDAESSTSYVTTQKAENFSYEVRLQNKSASNLEGLTVEYCIYYEQDESKGKKEGVLHGTLEVPSLLPKSTQELMTDYVTIYKDELDADYYYSSGRKNVLKGEVQGIWLQIHMKLASGETLTRNYCLPDSLSNSKAWASETVAVGMNSSRDNRKN